MDRPKNRKIPKPKPPIRPPNHMKRKNRNPHHNNRKTLKPNRLPMTTKSASTMCTSTICSKTRSPTRRRSPCHNPSGRIAFSFHLHSCSKNPVLTWVSFLFTEMIRDFTRTTWTSGSVERSIHVNYRRFAMRVQSDCSSVSLIFDFCRSTF